MEPHLLLTQEHQVILERVKSAFFDLVDQKPNSSQETDKLVEKWERLIQFCEINVEDNHHRKEEEFLFAAIRHNPKITAGGPMCTMYFDSFMFFTSIKAAQQLSVQLTGKEYQPQWPAHLQVDRDNNSPLTIPGEDHESGRLLVRLAKDLLTASKDIPFSETHQKLISIFRLYLDIQGAHFQREENCFFFMCRDLLTPAQWTEIGQKMATAYPTIRKDS